MVSFARLKFTRAGARPFSLDPLALGEMLLSEHGMNGQMGQASASCCVLCLLTVSQLGRVQRSRGATFISLPWPRSARTQVCLDTGMQARFLGQSRKNLI